MGGMVDELVETMVYDHPFTTLMLLLAIGMLVLLAVGAVLEWWTEKKERR